MTLVPTLILKAVLYKKTGLMFTVVLMVITDKAVPLKETRRHEKVTHNVNVHIM